MRFLILVSQKNYAVMGHILEEIKSVRVWPAKYFDYEKAFKEFTRQRVENKPEVAALIPKHLMLGFLNTIGGYKMALEETLKQPADEMTQNNLLHSKALLDGLTTEINSHLAEYSFAVK